MLLADFLLIRIIFLPNFLHPCFISLRSSATFLQTGAERLLRLFLLVQYRVRDALCLSCVLAVRADRSAKSVEQER